MANIYPLKDPISFHDMRLLNLDRESYNRLRVYAIRDRDGRCHKVLIGAIMTGEKRPPKAGEWYVSGATPEAYMAPNDLTSICHIARDW
jgi:hypothetical protein